MKKTIVLFLLFISFKGFTQTIDTTTMDGLYQYIFQKLDKTQIPTNYLQEYGVPLFDMTPYNGVLSSGNSVNINLWHSLYWQMTSAYTGAAGGSSFPSTDSANASIRQNQSAALPTPVVVLFGNFNTVKQCLQQ